MGEDCQRNMLYWLDKYLMHFRVSPAKHFGGRGVWQICVWNGLLRSRFTHKSRKLYTQLTGHTVPPVLEPQKTHRTRAIVAPRKERRQLQVNGSEFIEASTKELPRRPLTSPAKANFCGMQISCKSVCVWKYTWQMLANFYTEGNWKGYTIQTDIWMHIVYLLFKMYLFI